MSRLRPVLRTVLVVSALTAALLLAALALGAVVDRPLAYFTRDPSATLGAPLYVGLLSHVGVLVWWSCAVVCALAWALRRRDDERRSTALFAAAGITAYLALDDLFQIHEVVFPDMIGISQLAVIAAYALALAAYVAFFRRFVRESDWPLLALAVAFFAASVALDTLGDAVGWKNHLLEDGAKLFGIVAWSAYFVRIGVATIAGVPFTPRASRG